MIRRFPVLVLVFAFSVGAGAACTSQKKRPSGAEREKLISDETQQSSKQNYGQQQMGMDSLNMTPSEQAGMRHENATQPIEREGREKKK